MSIKVMNLVWGSSLEGSSKRFALLALADRGSDDGEITSLGVPVLCRKTGIKRSRMFALLKDLEEQDNLIQRVERLGPKGERMRSRFWINVPLLQAIQLPREDDRDAGEETNPFSVSAGQPPVQKLDGPPSRNWTGPVQKLDPQPVQKLDGARPGTGPLLPFSSSKDPDPESGPTQTENNPGHLEVASSIVADLDLTTIDAQPKQVEQVRQALVDALERGIDADVLAAYAPAKLAESQKVSYFLAGLGPRWLNRNTKVLQSNPTTPDWCGQCGTHHPDGWARRNPKFRVVRDPETGQEQPCETCHPDHSEATR